MMDRVAAHVAGAEDIYKAGASAEWADRFSRSLGPVEVELAFAGGCAGYHCEF